MKELRLLGFDLGASSGRAVLGSFDGKKLDLGEIFRFENRPVQTDKLRWDFERLFENVKIGLLRAGKVDSVAFDTWGVDFGLLSGGKLLENPICYRQERKEALNKTLSLFGESELYRRTGTQILPINTLVQLVALKDEGTLFRADKVLFMPDLFAHALCGSDVTDCTMASTSQLFDFDKGDFDDALISCLGLRRSLFPSVAKSGTVVGTTADGIKVVTAGHDTQCATATMDEGAFLSCGTWSLIGTTLDKPIKSDESRKSGLSNEMGADGRINYLKNIVGLWMIQECSRNFKMPFDKLASLAESAEPLRCFVDPDDEAFAYPCDMPEQIREYCRKTGQYVPTSEGEICRCVYESLALKYRSALCSIQALTGKKFDSLTIAGGGAKADLLCKMTACACGIPVVTGPVEASASGNILLQLKALCDLDIEDGKKLLSYEKRMYVPAERSQWAEAFDRFQKITEPHSGKGETL